MTRRMTKTNETLALALFAILTPLALADQGSITNSGGITNPPGTLTITATALSFISADGSTIINATFTSSSSRESLRWRRQGRPYHVRQQFHRHFQWNLVRQWRDSSD